MQNKHDCYHGIKKAGKRQIKHWSMQSSFLLQFSPEVPGETQLFSTSFRDLSPSVRTGADQIQTVFCLTLF